jgi:hypothetical protein
MPNAQPPGYAAADVDVAAQTAIVAANPSYLAEVMLAACFGGLK